MKQETYAQLHMMLIFIISNLLALILMPAYLGYKGSLGEEGNSPWIAFYYLAMVILFTAVILYIAKKKKVNLLKGIFYFGVTWTVFYAMFPIFYYIGVPFSDVVSLIFSVLVVIWLAKNPEWYVVNLVGIFMATGVALIFGMALGLVPIIIFLSAFAIYDAISVYKTKHMVALADNVIEYKLPALFVIPAKDDYSFKKTKSIKNKDGAKKRKKSMEREAYYMGYGDVLVPGILVVAAAANFGILAGIITLAGAVAAMFLLTAMVNSGKPQPGLPYLNAGAFAGFLLYLLMFG